MARLAAGEVLILDGAFGTELERMRAISNSPIWSAEILDKQPELVLTVHREYIQAGAEIITTGTFRTTRRALAKVGRAAEFEVLTGIAVGLAKQAAAEAQPVREIAVAGSIAPLEDCFSPELVPSQSECEDEHRAQARALANSGVDFLLAETFNSVRECAAVVAAAKETGLPVFLGVTCKPTGELLSGEQISGLVGALSGARPDCLLINCTPAEVLETALSQLAAEFDGPIGAYGNVGRAQTRPWENERQLSSSSYLEYARKWLLIGAQIIGGCCGTTPEFIRHLAFHLPKNSARRIP